MWSLGVIMYILLSGCMPFQGQNFDEVFEKVKAGSFHFDYVEFNHVSPTAKDLIQNLLVLDPEIRFSASDALAHPWLEQYDSRYTTPTCETFEHKLVERLTLYRGVSHLKRAALNIMVKMNKEEDIQHITAQFQKMNKDGTGMITVEELQNYLESKNLRITREEIKAVIKEIDYKGNGKINYSDFLAATYDVQNGMCEGKLRSVFAVFDTDHTGFITAENLKFAY